LITYGVLLVVLLLVIFVVIVIVQCTFLVLAGFQQSSLGARVLQAPNAQKDEHRNTHEQAACR